MRNAIEGNHLKTNAVRFFTEFNRVRPQKNSYGITSWSVEKSNEVVHGSGISLEKWLIPSST